MAAQEHDTNAVDPGIREWRVVTGLVRADDALLLVQNRRRGGSLDWSPPGGVIDAGEQPLGALAREVYEETGLHVESWSDRRYEITVAFPDLAMSLSVLAFEATRWQGDLVVADPDGIVVDAEYVALDSCATRLAPGPRWVSEPLLDWLQHCSVISDTYRYAAHGGRPDDLSVERI